MKKNSKKCKCSNIKGKMPIDHTCNTLVELDYAIETKRGEIVKLREIIKEINVEIGELEEIRNSITYIL